MSSKHGHNFKTPAGSAESHLPLTPTEMRARQSAKLREIGNALITAGFTTVEQQAKVLGLSRSTTWTITGGLHKCSGLSVGVLRRILAMSQLPPSVRTAINEYIKDKIAGTYGHDEKQLRKFAGRLSEDDL
jgi:hypothetical protein